MSAQPLEDFSRLAIHSMTTKPWDWATAGQKYYDAGVRGITVWRQCLEGLDDDGIRLVGHDLRNYQLHVVSLCPGGFFPAADEAGRRKSIADNLRAIEEAALLGAPMVVLVCGAIPGLPLEEARRQIVAGIAELLPAAEAAGVRLAIEPLHPMHADCLSAVNTLKQANDMCEALASEWVGVAADVYHLWWDPDLESELRRCGENGWLLALHLCDWLTPTVDLLNDRGLMGEGCIPIRQIRGWAEEAGFDGFLEVEILSNRWWATDQDAFLEKIKEAYLAHA